MSDHAVVASGVAKQYRIGRAQGYRTFRDEILATIRGLPTALRHGRRPPEPSFWALSDVSFAIAPGEVVGIIGRNGAGKSTLLKILARVTEPTSGEILLRGRLGALLEVGTGFHPELTGRENIFLSGAVLGMKRHEIRAKFDAIVAFAEVEKFLDTQVKHYSSGMFTRLAFAVAAHLEPEILVVDEVLAVGDASFQRKCLNKMEDVGKEGRTVIFVSHNMPAVTRLCPRSILLDSGRVVMDGPSTDVVSTYLHSGLGTMAAREWTNLSVAPGNEVVRLTAVRVRAHDGAVSAAIDIRRRVGIEMDFQVLQGGHKLVPNLHVFNDEGVNVFVSSELSSAWRGRERAPGQYRVRAWIPGNLLAEGTLIVNAAISTLDPVRIHVYERDAVAFQVVDSIEGDSARGDYGGPIPGVVRPMLQWETIISPTTAAEAVS